MTSDPRHVSAAASVVSLRSWLLARRDFDRLLQMRTHGRGYVDQYPTKVGEGRDRPGQLRIERAYPDDH